MRQIDSKIIRDCVTRLCIKANVEIRPDVKRALVSAYRKETNKRSKGVLKVLIENAQLASREALPICQDTGMVVVFAEVGQDAHIKGSLAGAINAGVRLGYKKGLLRKSVVGDPLRRENTKTNAPACLRQAVIHINIVKGDKIKLTVFPKGFGSENKSRVIMLNPTCGIKEIEEFVVGAVKEAGPDACPPFIVGVGIGGMQDTASFLAKEALLGDINKRNKDRLLAQLEGSLFKKINALNIGPMAFGGKVTALSVKVKIAPTHIAGLPIAVNISCHALRSASAVI